MPEYIDRNQSSNDWEREEGFTNAQAEIEASASRALLEAGFDFFEAHRPKQPKAEIGAYVARQGFEVPLITSQAEWEQAFDAGVAMLRSEDAPDYDGLSGLFSSEVLSQDLQTVFTSRGKDYDQRCGQLVMEGLRSGELDPTEYMRYIRGYRGWAEEEIFLSRDMGTFGFESAVWRPFPTASRWRYIEGTNIRVFADPHVEGRYHFGVIPFDPDSGHQAVGSYQVEPDQHNAELKFRKHKQPFVAKDLIGYYEQIRSLPYFDTTQNPVLELQQSPDGQIYFLQYFKTNQKRQLTEPLELPRSATSIVTDNVRGITPTEGKQYKLFLAPGRLTEDMRGQAIFCSILKPRGIGVQLASEFTDFILHEAHISFKNNHFSAAPLYRPQLAAGLDSAFYKGSGNSESALSQVQTIVDNSRYRVGSNAVCYVDINVISNGHQAVIDSDWQVKHS